jgi:hypothetical protein
VIVNVNGVPVTIAGGLATWRTRTLEVDVDGAPNAYGPDDSSALDALANAGHSGNWWALATDTGLSSGTPLVQGDGDPFPGYYIAETALADHAKPQSDPTRYLDARVVPYLSVPVTLLHAGIGKGDLGVLEWLGKRIGIIVGEVGPGCEEASLAVHIALGFDPQRDRPRHHLIGSPVQASVTIFCGSAQSPVWPVADVNATALALADS